MKGFMVICLLICSINVFAQEEVYIEDEYEMVSLEDVYEAEVIKDPELRQEMEAEEMPMTEQCSCEYGYE